MSSTFSGFSEEDLQRIKSNETIAAPQDTGQFKKIEKLGGKPKRYTNSYKLPALQKQNSDDAIYDLDFKKCKLSIRSPTTTDRTVNSNENEEREKKNIEIDINTNESKEEMKPSNDAEINDAEINDAEINDTTDQLKQNSVDVAPDIVRGVNSYTEDDLASHRAKLDELQLKQKIMEEQNKKRKEMLAKALADRTKQTEEEVMRLEKIKKELQVLDGQFSQDVAVLRKKIDQACLSYAEAEKYYLKVEKEFLQAKISLQKEKEKKELLTEHLCALITHNETRKAQKLETLMLELASDKRNKLNNTKFEVNDTKVDTNHKRNGNDHTGSTDDESFIIDGVDQRSGKIVEFNTQK